MSGSAVVATLSAAVSGTQAPTGWRCVRLVVKERIARPYRVTLDFLATEAGVNPASVIGTGFDVTYAWNNGISGQSGQRRWSGTLTQLTYMGRVHDTRFPVHYRAVLVPSLALAGMTRRSRAFVAPPDPGTCTVKDVLARLVQELGQTADQTNILDTSYPPRPFFTQYAESDLDFLSRLVETFGISFFWTADTGQGSRLLFTDNENGFQPIDPVPPGGSTPGTLPVNPNAGPASGVRAVHRLTMRFGQVPASATTLTWKPPTAPGADGTMQSGTWPIAGEQAKQRFGLMPVEASTTEFREEPIISVDTAWTGTSTATIDPRAWWDRLAQIRMEEASVGRAQLHGHSNLEGLFAGCAIRFDYQDSALGLVPQYDVNGYLVYAITHTVMAQGSELCFPAQDGVPDGGTLYVNRFRAMPAMVTGAGAETGFSYRPPRRTAVPAIATLHHATLVTGVEGQASPDLDTAGQYLVMPDFPLENVSGTGDPPKGLRMPKLHHHGLTSIALGGSTRAPAGLHMPMRPGQAVLVGFVAGDPDRPFIAGLLPDAAQPSPVSSTVASLPRQSVLRTASGLTIRLTDSV